MFIPQSELFVSQSVLSVDEPGARSTAGTPEEVFSWAREVTRATSKLEPETGEEYMYGIRFKDQTAAVLRFLEDGSVRVTQVPGRRLLSEIIQPPEPEEEHDWVIIGPDNPEGRTYIAEARRFLGLGEPETQKPDQEFESHESFGTIALFRGQGTSQALFDSNVTHQEVIIVEISEAKRRRSLSEERVFPEELLLRFAMSPNQWANFISGVGQGGGVPVTLNYVHGDQRKRQQPPPPEGGKRFELELGEFTQEMTGELDRMIAASKGRQKRELEKIRNMLVNQLPFMERQFVRYMNRTVTEAKADVDAHIGERLRTMGLERTKSPDFILPPAAGEGEGPGAPGEQNGDGEANLEWRGQKPD